MKPKASETKKQEKFLNLKRVLSINKVIRLYQVVFEFLQIGVFSNWYEYYKLEVLLRIVKMMLKDDIS